MPDNSQKLQLIQAIRQSGYPGSVTEVFQAYDQGQDLIGQWVQQQEQQQQMQEMQQQGPQGPQGMAQGGPSLPPPNRKPDGRVSQPDVNQPLSNDQGHLVQSQTPSDVGIQDLPTGPARPQRIQVREGGIRQYKKGGVRKSKSYIEKFRSGGGIFRTKKQKEIDEANQNILKGNFYETPTIWGTDNSEYDEDYNLYANTIEELGQESLSYNDYVKNIKKYGHNITNQMYTSDGKIKLPTGVVGSDPTLGFDPHTGDFNTMSSLNKMYNVGVEGKSFLPEGFDFNTYDPNKTWLDNTPGLINEVDVNDVVGENNPYAYENYDDINKLNYLDQDAPVNEFGLTDAEMITANNQIKYNSRYGGGTGILGYNTDQGIPVSNTNFMGTNYGDYLNAQKQFKTNQMTGAVHKAGSDFTGAIGDMATDLAMAPVNFGKWAWNNPKDAALLGVDVLAGIGVTAGAAEPITTGLGASWLAYRGGDAFYKQYKRNQANPELYDPIGFNLETGLNASYFLPGMSTYGRGANTAFKYGRTLPFKQTGQHLLGQAVTGTKNLGTGLKTTFTKTPFRNTFSNTINKGTSTVPINTKYGLGANIQNRFGNTTIGRTFNTNVQNTQKSWNLLTNPKSIPFESPMSTRLFTNKNMIRVPTGSNTYKVIAPGSQINTAGGAYNMFRGGVGTAYSGLKTLTMPLSMYGIGEHLSSPSNFTSLDKNLEFGTDLANTMLGGQTLGDAIKIGTYAGQGKTDKAWTQGLGLLSPFKTVTKFKKTYDKIKGFGDPNKFFSQSTTSPLLQPDYSKGIQINPNATSLFKT